MTEHRSPDERADQILTAARDLFLEKGYFEARMDEIARASDLSKGGIYFHFDTKKEIFRSLVEQEYDRAMTFIEEILSSEEEIESMIADIGRHFAERFATTDSARFMAIIGEMALRDEEIREMLLELQENYIQRLAELLQRGMDEGQLRQMDPRSAAILLKSIIDGIRAGFGIGFQPDIDRLVGTTMQILGDGMFAESLDSGLAGGREVELETGADGEESGDREEASEGSDGTQ
ncbi:MAG: TetR/AcrR family transcriptional regulator [Bradymonadaceae bacterium]